MGAIDLSIIHIQLIGVLYNLRSMCLVILGFANGLDEIIRWGGTIDVELTDDESKLKDCLTMKSNTDGNVGTSSNLYKMYSPSIQKDSWVKIGVGFLVPFVLIVLTWICVFIYKSGAYKHRIDTLGFHVKWMNTRRQPWYKCFIGLIVFYMSVAVIFSMSQPYFNMKLFEKQFFMVATVGIALFDLYTPVEETITFEEEALNMQLKNFSFWMTDATRIVETFQDAVTSARMTPPDYSHINQIIDEEKSETEIMKSLLTNMNSIAYTNDGKSCFSTQAKTPAATDVELEGGCNLEVTWSESEPSNK